MKYLFKPNEIRKCMNELFSVANEKWALVGFVGYGALDQLPKDVVGLNVICWPKAGATHPDGVRRLLKGGVTVYFCENLHHKLYWTKDVGLIVGSANLSARALRGSVQHEFCVYCDDPKFDIKPVLSELKYSKVREEALHKLDLAHAAEMGKSPDLDEPLSVSTSFLQASSEKFPKKWKIAVWNEEREPSGNEAIKNVLEKEFGQRKFLNNNDVDNNVFEIGDFVLQVRIGTESEKIKTANCKWLRVEFVMKRGRNSIIVQLKKMADGVAPPFVIDKDFKAKFKAAFNDDEFDKIVDAKAAVRKKFIAKLRNLYQDR